MTPTYHQHVRIFEAARDAIWTPPLDPDRGLKLMVAIADELQKHDVITDALVETTIATVRERLAINLTRFVSPLFRHDA